MTNNIAQAISDLGVSHIVGIEVENDPVMAAELFQTAADMGLAEAQTHLAVLYSLGNGVKKDDVKASELFHLAANQGYAHAQYHLGFSYALGRGVAKDTIKAAEFFQAAADQGHTAAMREMFKLCDINVFDTQSDEVVRDTYRSVRQVSTPNPAA